MRRSVGLILVLIAVIAAWRLWRSVGPMRALDVITYRGQKIKLSKSYYDYSDYKNDPDNIHPSETERVQKLVMGAPVAASYANHSELARAMMMEIKFPGYGAGFFRGHQLDGTELQVVTIEIPRADKDRYLVFRNLHEKYELIDDFVNSEIPYPSEVREQDGAYVFYGTGGKELFRRARPQETPQQRP